MTLEDEARQIGRYFLGANPGEREVELYVKAHASLDFPLSAWERSLLRLALSNRGLAGFIDGGLALRRPASSVRKKFFVMLAILETSPEHCELFFQPSFGIAGIFGLGLRMAWAGLKGGAGFAFVSLHEAFWSIRTNEAT